MKPFLIIFLVLPYLSVTLTVNFPDDEPIKNPVIVGENLPDPGVLLHEGIYYVANTGGTATEKFPIHSSANLQDWNFEGYAFVENALPSWTTESSNFWAPELHIINGQFRLIFTARESDSGFLCIGIGKANKITGPYTDVGAPVVRNKTVGSIDASVMTLANSVYYLIWKDEGNNNHPPIPTWIKAQRLENNGTAVTGEIFYLISNTLAWEADLVEGPWIVYRDKYFYLFYSGHSYCNASYAVGVARSLTPFGPYEKKGDPILKSNDVWIGPGHCSVVNGNQTDSWYMVYHSWHEGQVCGDNNRLLMVDPVYWNSDSWPYMNNSSPSL